VIEWLLKFYYAESVPDKNQKGKNNCVVLSTTYLLLESLKHLNLEVLILAWHSLAACIMHMWIRVLCKIINQLHRVSCLLHDFQREQLKSSLPTHKIIQQFYIVWAFPVLCHGNNPTLEYKNKKFPFEGPTRQTLNFVCSIYINTHYVSHINSRFSNYFSIQL